jgi:hypothetical protein
MLSRSSRLAFLAGGHPRCGVNSPLLGVSSYIMKMIVSIDDGVEHVYGWNMKPLILRSWGGGASTDVTVKNGVVVSYLTYTADFYISSYIYKQLTAWSSDAPDLSINTVALYIHGLIENRCEEGNLPYGWCREELHEIGRDWRLSIHALTRPHESVLSKLFVEGDFDLKIHLSASVLTYNYETPVLGEFSMLDGPVWTTEPPEGVARLREIIEKARIPTHANQKLTDVISKQVKRALGC